MNDGKMGFPVYVTAEQRWRRRGDERAQILMYIAVGQQTAFGRMLQPADDRPADGDMYTEDCTARQGNHSVPTTAKTAAFEDEHIFGVPLRRQLPPPRQRTCHIEQVVDSMMAVCVQQERRHQNLPTTPG